eukprot:1139852-Pelagomonas_calceolata.AAC.11
MQIQLPSEQHSRNTVLILLATSKLAKEGYGPCLPLQGVCHLSLVTACHFQSTRHALLQPTLSVLACIPEEPLQIPLLTVPCGVSAATLFPHR